MDIRIFQSAEQRCRKKKRGYTGVFKRLRRNRHLEYQKAANSSAQTVTLEAQPEGKAPVCEA
jgi:hypothetical protein